jgi:hypothetical protein
MDHARHSAEAFVELNDPHVAVRMRRLLSSEEWLTMVLSDAGIVMAAADIKLPVRLDEMRRPRISESDTHRAAYFELLNLEDSNAVADKLKAKLVDLGYKIVDKKFPV